MNRDEFEKMPEIAKRLHAGIYWNDYQGKYQTDSKNLLETVGYLNGAWYAYQERQKKIDAVLSAISQSELYGDRAIWGIQDEIKELLK